MAIANCVIFARGSFITKNGRWTTGLSSSGLVIRSPFGPTSVIFGGASLPVATIVAPGRPAGNSMSWVPACETVTFGPAPPELMCSL